MYGDALTTVARVKARIGKTITDADDLLETMILAVTARIQTMCNRRFIQAEYENELHDGSDFYGTRRLILIPKNAPIQVIDTIEYNAGTNSDPNWTEISVDDYDFDADAGLVHMHYPLPAGRRNIRITYTAGFSGYSIGVSNFWFFNVTPTGTVDGDNGTFTLTEDATQVIVYADGVRLASANVTFTPGAATFTIAAPYVPYSTIAVDYLRENAYSESDLSLPLDLVEVAEKAVVRTYKKRDAEGRTSETLNESTTTWEKDIFTAEDLRTIKNYRRGYNL
jgi:hypothetical protein